MCGIVYVKRKDGLPAAKSVKKRYQTQKSRGTEGYGYVAIKDNEIVSYKRAPTEHEIMQLLDKETAPEILFHHRFPTSGPNVEEMAHPIFVASKKLLKYQYFVAHNGVIRNALERKTEHYKQGFLYSTELREALRSPYTGKTYDSSYCKFNDSEALATDTALVLEGKENEILSEGPAAIVAIVSEGKKVIDRVFYRNHANPLYITSNDHMVSLTSGFQKRSSEVTALHIKRLNEEDKMEDHPSKAYVPTAYSYPNTGYFRGDSKAPSLGARQRYHEDMDDFYFPGEAYSPKDDIEYALDEKVLAAQKESELEDDFEFVDLEGENIEAVLPTLSLEILWDEYKKCLDSQGGLQDLIQKIDDRVNLNGEYSADIFESRKKLQSRLDRVNKYEVLLSTEITRKETDQKKQLLLV